MASVFDSIKPQTANIRKSANWYRSQVKRLTGGITARELIKAGKVQGRPSVGRLNLFGYNPKLRLKLPYYDVFPLVLPLEPTPGGFLGMNFHYLPPSLRFRLLERMQEFASNKRFDKGDRFEVNYDDVRNMRIVKPTIKRYLYGFTQTGFLRINMNEAPSAIYLPLQRFKKADEKVVYANSRRFL